MEASLVHTRPDTSKIDHFNGTFFKRWQEMVFSTIDVVNLWYILTDPKSEDGLICYQPGKLEINKLDMLLLVPFLMNFLIFIDNLKL